MSSGPKRPFFVTFCVSAALYRSKKEFEISDGSRRGCIFPQAVGKKKNCNMSVDKSVECQRINTVQAVETVEFSSKLLIETDSQ